VWQASTSLHGYFGDYAAFGGVLRFMLALGVVMLPIGLFRGGLPQLSSGKTLGLGAIGIGLATFILMTAALQIGPFKVKRLSGP
jgi:hypothetical protein